MSSTVSAELLVCDHVSFSHPGQTVLSDVSLSIGPGELVALVGPNGSGKSTLLRLAVGLLEPQEGTISLFGEEPGRGHLHGRLGYVPQRPNLGTGVAATVSDIVSSGRLTRRGWWRRDSEIDRSAVQRALDAVDLADLGDERLSRLSGGQQQRAFIARALAGEPELLVLDEPVAGVDVESQERFRAALVDLVRERGGTVLLVSHELSAVVGNLDRVIVLKERIRFDGPPEGLAAHEGIHLGVHEADLPVWLERIT